MSNYEYPDNDELLNMLDDMYQPGGCGGSGVIDDIDNPKKPVCTVCNTDQYFVNDRTLGLVVCQQCATVCDTVFDVTPEWNQYTNNGKQELGRCSQPINIFFPQASLGTSIKNSKYLTIGKLQSWGSMPYKERSLSKVYKEIKFICNKHNIIKYILNDAKILYKRISDTKHVGGDKEGKNIITRGKNRKGIIAACLYFACKRKGNTRSPKEIAKMFNLTETHVTKGCKSFLKLLKISNMEYEFNSSSPVDFIKRYAHELGLSQRHSNEVILIATNVHRLKIASKNTPLSIAMGCILLIAKKYNLSVSKKTITQRYNISEVTSFKAFKKIEVYQNILAHNDIVEKIIERIKIKRSDTVLPEHLKIKLDRLNNVN